MVPALALVLFLAQPPVSQPYRHDAVASAALGRTMKYRVLLPADYATSGGQYWSRRMEIFLPWLMKQFARSSTP